MMGTYGRKGMVAPSKGLYKSTVAPVLFILVRVHVGTGVPPVPGRLARLTLLTMVGGVVCLSLAIWRENGQYGGSAVLLI
jgi:hypothetical protein